MGRIDTRTLVSKFFALSQKDFDISSKSKSSEEQSAYLAMKDADIEGGSPDGKITYSEYLAYVNKTTPGSIAGYDFAISKILPLLRDVKFDDEGFTITGFLTSAWQLNKDMVIPTDTKICLTPEGSLRVFTAGDFKSGNLTINGGRHNSIQFDFLDGQGYFLAQLQITKNSIINDIPCLATTPADFWDINLQLQSNGLVKRAILSDKLSKGDVVYLLKERIQQNAQGEVVSAFLLQNRQIQGKSVVAYVNAGANLGAGLLAASTPAPNIYFEKGKIQWCYEENKVLEGTTISGVNCFRYDDKGAVSGIYVPTNAFLGYPIKLSGTPDWNNPPPPMVNIVEGKAQFALESPVQITGKEGSVSLAANAIVTVDLKSGNCIEVLLPTGAKLSYDPLSQMKPVQGAFVTKAQSLFDTQYAAIANMLFSQGVLQYVNKSAGNVSANVFIDLNGDGKAQDAEVITNTASQLLPADILTAVVKVAPTMAQLQQIKILRIFFENGSKSYKPEEISQLQKEMDRRIGAVLARNGVQALKDLKVFYLPDGTGNKVVGDFKVTEQTLPWGKTINVHTDTPAIIVTLPDGRAFATKDAQWYAKTGALWGCLFSDSVNGNGDTTLPDGNRVVASSVNFYPSGALQYAPGLWAGSKIVLPNGVEVLNPAELFYYESGALQYASFYDPVDVPLKAGQKIKVKGKIVTIPKDVVYKGLTVKLFFSESGAINEILVWGNVPAIFK